MRAGAILAADPTEARIAQVAAGREPSGARLALPRGVASSERTLGFVKNARDGIDALRLDTGALIWSVAIAAEPLAAAGGRLVAGRPSADLPNSLELLLLSIPDQGRVVRACRLEFPETVSVASGDARDFQSAVTLEGSVVRLEWRGRSRYRGGAPPPDSLARAARGVMEGVLRCDLDDCAVTTEAPPQAPAVPMPPSLPYRVRSVWSEHAWSHGDGLASLAIAGPAGDRRLVLQLRGAADSQPQTVELLEGEAFEVHVTQDGKYLFARATRPQPRAEWSVFAAAGGARMALLPYEEGSQWPCVLAGRVFFLVVPAMPGRGPGLALDALDIRTGRLLWRHDLGVSDRGPTPPAR